MEPVHRKGECGGVRTGVTMSERKMGPRFSDWCAKAVGEVLFLPDRKQIERELTDHFEDHRDALLALGYSAEEATEQAIEAMGDPKEVGRALNRVHKFWLGVVWQVSRTLVILLALIVTVELASTHFRDDPWVGPLATRTETELAYEAPPSWADRTETPAGTVYLAPSREITEGYEGRTQYHARLWVEAKRPLTPDFWSRNLRYVDQTGDVTRKFDLNLEEPGNQVWLYSVYEPYQQIGWYRAEYDVVMELDHRPDFLVVSQPYGEAPWTLRCEWEAVS